MSDTPSFLERHQFLIYRLFSLSGLIPVGAFLVVHLLTNSSVLGGAAAFQARVDMIHSFGPLVLTVLEWVFIFIPILFHAAVGFVIMSNGMPNVSSYPYSGNIRYTLQRVTGMIAFVFILCHVSHLHWLGAWMGGGQFDPHFATSTAAEALRPTWVTVLYAIGVLSAVFHFANGLWSIGITWGLWTSPAAMQRANVVSIVAGLGLAAAGLGSLAGFKMVDVDEARAFEEWHQKQREQLEPPGAGSIHPARSEGK